MPRFITYLNHYHRQNRCIVPVRGQFTCTFLNCHFWKRSRHTPGTYKTCWKEGCASDFLYSSQPTGYKLFYHLIGSLVRIRAATFGDCFTMNIPFVNREHVKNCPQTEHSYCPRPWTVHSCLLKLTHSVNVPAYTQHSKNYC